MSAKISVEVTSLGKSCRFLLSALMRQGRQVDTILTKSTEPHRQDGDGEPRFLDSIVALGRRLEASMDQLVKADHRIYDANVALTLLRQSRDELAASLADAIVRMRRTILGDFANPHLEGLGLTSPRLRSPDPLLRQSDVIAEAFASDDLPRLLGDTEFGDDVSLRAKVDSVHHRADALRTTLVRIDDALRLLDEEVIAKDAIMNEHEELFVYTARSFEAWCILAGQRKLAAKVRPSERRLGRTEQEVVAEESLPPPEGGAPPEEPPNDAVTGSPEETSTAETSTA